MELSARRYLGLVGAIGALRLVELGLSRRHQAALRARGAELVPEPGFGWMVLLHVATLLAAPLEVGWLRRRASRPLALGAGAALALANLLRWWVIRAMGPHWNVRIVDSTRLGVIERGPFRWVRHPNYLAVALELAALPLVHSAWLTALAAGVANGLVLRRRVAAEEAVLMADADYRRLMGHKPRFLPGLL
jgi:methyltransferase